MKPNIKKLLILNAPYLLFVWLFMKIGEAFRLSPGADLSGKLLHIMEGVTAAFENPMPSLNGQDFLIGIAGAVILRIAVYMKGKNAKKYRKGVEYGSARWGNAKDIEPYIDPDFYNNVLLTQTERLTMNSRPKSPKYARNKNVLVIGGSGSGKTRFFVKPNLMQMHSSYCVTDPKGTILIECGKLLDRGGYKIKVLNTINFKKSMHYNPFAYLHSEKDILKLVNTIMVNTKGEGEKSSEDFWTKAEKLYYTALIGYIYYEAPEEEKNFTTLLDMINASEAREDDEDFKNPVDLMFDRLEEKDPEHFAVKQYKKYKLAAGKTAKSILISCGARLAPFDIKELVVLHQNGENTAHYVDSIGYREVPKFLREQKQLTPDELTTGEQITTPRGSFHVTAMNQEQMKAAGYGVHHQSEDGKYYIMGNGTQAFAVAVEQPENYLKAAEQTTEQNANMIDGVINNTPTADGLETNAGEQISLEQYAETLKQDEAAEPDTARITAAAKSRYDGMVALFTMDDKIYIGKSENYDNKGHYDNKDNSLLYVTDCQAAFTFLSSEGCTYPQDEALNAAPKKQAAKSKNKGLEV